MAFSYMGEGEDMAEAKEMKCYNLVSQICEAGSEQHSKPMLLLVKGKPDLRILKSNVIERICADTY